MTDEKKLWQTKLAALLHDPPEKALILGRHGHESGTVWHMLEYLGLQEFHGRAGPVRKADWWASAADRPQWPGEVRVDWLTDPVLVHPLSGAQVDLGSRGRLRDVDLDGVQEDSFEHAKHLADKAGKDPWKTLLALWRFGADLAPEQDRQRLGDLWGLLPADTRVPDHAIWEHLDLVSAFTGAFAADPNEEVALLALAIGPVQPFIAAARKTQDLWAGSHLLSRLSWEAMRPVAEALAPDAILFPRLRGVPQVDLWLRDQGLPDDLFAGCAWKERATDANPLFAAALPNRFVALVPASQVRALAERCATAVQDWLQETGARVVDRLLDVADLPEGKGSDAVPAYRQMREQLEGFPEVHWASVPFSLIRQDADGKASDAQPELSAAMAPFFGASDGEPCGFLPSPAWQVLSRSITWGDDTHFYLPNPGVLYPAVWDLAERVLSAAKAVRTFKQREQHGWRESLTGEAEWLRERERTDTGEPLWLVPPGQRTGERPAVETLWTRVAARRSSWARKGEHLGGLSAIKRLWPTLFAEEVAETLGTERQQVPRFVVSTHTMALAHQLDRWLASPEAEPPGYLTAAVEQADPDWTMLPRGLVQRHATASERLRAARQMAGLLERAQEETEDETRAASWRQAVRRTLREGLCSPRLEIETYYGLLLMDGDRMGAILAGDLPGAGEAEAGRPAAITYLESFHPKVREAFRQRQAGSSLLADYGAQLRPPSPGRHEIISGALNDFALHVVPHVVEEEYLGRLIYAGGDDVLAMLPVADLLPAAERLRRAYSGRGEQEFGDEAARGVEDGRLALGRGFARLRGRLMRMMGERATASAGLVVAHHQTPLSRVLREGRAAEKAAKDAGRDRCAIRILKRSGGALHLVLHWHEVPLLEALRAFLAAPGVSRRAVYNTLVWLRDLPPPKHGDGEMLERLLRWQLRRQSEANVAAWERVARHIPAVAEHALGRSEPPLAWLAAFLSVAEFLARETRAAGAGAGAEQPAEVAGA